MRKAVVLLLTVAAFAACGPIAPYQREIVDNRDPRRARIDAVRDDGTIDLADGRRVRLFGLDVPADPEARTRYFARIRRFVGEEASVTVALPEDPPAVALGVWQRAFICGNGLATWNPDPPPMNGWHVHPVAPNLAIEFVDALRPADLENPAADPDAVKSIRDAHDYGIRHRAGEAP